MLAHSLLGRAAEAAGDASTAVAAHRRVLALDPADRYGAAIALARLGAGPVPGKASDAFVRGLFDEYAERFDTELLERLRYRGPDLLLAAIRGALGTGPFDVFDAGCGTGLMGAAIKPLARGLIGADLSPRMVEEAGRRGVYDTLLVGDLAPLLAAAPAHYDLVTAADVLVYTGDLAPIFTAVAAALRAGGAFAFTVERSPDQDWRLNESGRYAHSAAYLRRLADECGLAATVLDEASTRDDRGVPVAGLVCVMRKPS